jgi:hypothetical protein
MTDVAISYVFASEEETMNNIFDSNPIFKFLELETCRVFGRGDGRPGGQGQGA